MKLLLSSLLVVLLQTSTAQQQKQTKNAPPVKVQQFSLGGDGNVKHDQSPQEKHHTNQHEDSHIPTNLNKKKTTSDVNNNTYEAKIVGGEQADEGEYPYFGT